MAPQRLFATPWWGFPSRGFRVTGIVADSSLSGMLSHPRKTYFTELRRGPGAVLRLGLLKRRQLRRLVGPRCYRRAARLTQPVPRVDHREFLESEIQQKHELSQE
ncbi:hypothetical protein N9H39_11880, partial [Gammaproteobacteria bacterium]|nr:hypothetical protein [Gammaproteobacteria bacterium]